MPNVETPLNRSEIRESAVGVFLDVIATMLASLPWWGWCLLVLVAGLKIRMLLWMAARNALRAWY
jgi:hypothetical protein